MNRLALSLVAFLLVSSIGLGWLFDYVFQAYGPGQGLQQDPRMQHIEALLGPVAELADNPDASDVLSQVERLSPQVQLDLVPASQLSLPDALSKQLESGQVLTIEDEQGITLFKRLEKTRKLLVLSLPPEDMTRPAPWIRMAFTGAFYLLLVAMLLLWLWPLIKRLLVLRQAARQFGQGQFEKRIEVGGISYIRDLETDFNQMAQQIERLIADVKLISSAVSHDLRTPLAKIRLGLDILSEEADPEKRHEYETRIDQHLDDMVELVETLLGYARLEQARPTLEKTRQNLAKMLPAMIEQTKDGSKRLSLASQQGTPDIIADAKYLKIALNNVLHNAIKHAEAEVLVALRQSRASVTVSISDDGEGVDPKLANDLFKPFVRGDQAKESGFGMGLAIVHRILEWHQASVSVDICPKLGGARFTLTFATA